MTIAYALLDNLEMPLLHNNYEVIYDYLYYIAILSTKITLEMYEVAALLLSFERINEMSVQLSGDGLSIDMVEL